jgi:hypothetical protein
MGGLQPDIAEAMPRASYLTQNKSGQTAATQRHDFRREGPVGMNRDATSRLAEAMGLTLKSASFGTNIFDGDGKPINFGNAKKHTLQQAQDHLIDRWTAECAENGVEPNLAQFR